LSGLTTIDQLEQPRKIREARVDERVISAIGTPRALKVYLALAAHASKERTAYPRIDTIAKMTGIDRRHVQTALRELERTGFVATFDRRVPNGGSRSWLFRLQSPPEDLVAGHNADDFISIIFTTLLDIQEIHGAEVSARFRRHGERSATLNSKLNRKLFPVNIVLQATYAAPIDEEARSWVKTMLELLECHMSMTPTRSPRIETNLMLGILDQLRCIAGSSNPVFTDEIAC
jgi:hypothetical protein